MKTGQKKLSNHLNNNGFTMIELIGVILILGIIMVLVFPNIFKYFGDSVTKAMEVSEGKVLDASYMYIEDYCNNPISISYTCPISYRLHKLIRLSDIQNAVHGSYIDQVKAKNSVCTGIIDFTKGSEKVYLKCDDEYNTDADKYTELDNILLGIS